MAAEELEEAAPVVAVSVGMKEERAAVGLEVVVSVEEAMGEAESEAVLLAAVAMVAVRPAVAAWTAGGTEVASEAVLPAAVAMVAV